MSKDMTITFGNSKTTLVIQFSILIGIAYFAPFLHQQFLTGTIVNATLVIATVILGVQVGVLVGLLPSVIALSVGTLPSPLAPMVPYIMIGNAIFVILFGMMRKSYWTAIMLSSLLKFVFLYTTSFVVINLLFKKELAPSVSAMMSWPQLVTALSGGMVAFIFLKIFQNNNKDDNYKQLNK